jgi:hypothetical protein
MSSLNTDLVLLPFIRGKLSELFSDDGIKDVQQLKVTQQLGEIFGYVLVYHNKDVPKTMLHASMEELSKWKKEARKQGSTAFEEYPDTVQNYAKWPTERLKRNITAQGDQGQLHHHISWTNYNTEETTAQQQYDELLRLLKEQCKRRRIRHQHWCTVLLSENQSGRITKKKKGRATPRV